ARRILEAQSCESNLRLFGEALLVGPTLLLARHKRELRDAVDGDQRLVRSDGAQTRPLQPLDARVEIVVHVQTPPEKLTRLGPETGPPGLGGPHPRSRCDGTAGVSPKRSLEELAEKRVRPVRVPLAQRIDQRSADGLGTRRREPPPCS